VWAAFSTARRAGDAATTSGAGLEASGGDGKSAPLAHAVRAALDTREGRVQLREIGGGLRQDSNELRALERDGGAFGIVLVIGVGVARGGHHLVEGLLKRLHA